MHTNSKPLPHVKPHVSMFWYCLLQILSQVSLAQSNASDSATGQASSPSPAQTVLNSLQYSLGASGTVNGLTIQPTITARSNSQNLTGTAQIKTYNNAAQAAHILGKITEMGATGHSTAAVNLTNQILATRVSSTQLVNHVPSSLEGLMPSELSFINVKRLFTVYVSYFLG